MAENKAGEAVGEFFVWLWDDVLSPVLGGLFTTTTGGVITGALVLLFLCWRFSLAMFPDKKCIRCDGNGSWGPGLLRKECGRCKGKGRLPRVGS